MLPSLPVTDVPQRQVYMHLWKLEKWGLVEHKTLLTGTGRMAYWRLSA
jgi:hypothetical protein